MNVFDTQLIVLDGLPGSGKSTNGTWLAKQLHKHGISARFLAEAEISHPLWWYDHWDGENYLLPDFDHIPIERFIQTSLEKWKNFVVEEKATGQVYVTESVFFQNSPAIFLMGGAEPAKLIEYAREVQQIVRELNPILIYFYQTDVAAALLKICDVRGKGFEDELVQNMERFPYLKQRGLKGLEGVISLWRNIRTLTDSLFEEYTIRKLALEVSKGDWANYRQQILEFLTLNSKL